MMKYILGKRKEMTLIEEVVEMSLSADRETVCVLKDEGGEYRVCCSQCDVTHVLLPTRCPPTRHPPTCPPASFHALLPFAHPLQMPLSATASCPPIPYPTS